jgi:uncharacterized lipoprotein NlpE involved in copper resistance
MRVVKQQVKSLMAVLFLLVQKRNQKKTGSDKYSVKLTETPASDKTTCSAAQNLRSAAKTVLSFSRPASLFYNNISQKPFAVATAKRHVQRVPI